MEKKGFKIQQSKKKLNSSYFGTLAILSRFYRITTNSNTEQTANNNVQNSYALKKRTYLKKNLRVKKSHIILQYINYIKFLNILEKVFNCYFERLLFVSLKRHFF